MLAQNYLKKATKNAEGYIPMHYAKASDKVSLNNLAGIRIIQKLYWKHTDRK